LQQLETGLSAASTSGHLASALANIKGVDERDQYAKRWQKPDRDEVGLEHGH
jgi:hypothetical protein